MRKLYICPTCNKQFEDEETIVKHSLRCWKEHNPNHKSKPAPCKGNITERQVNEETLKFFASFRKD